MLYLRSTFTVPASNVATQKQWDRAFLSDEEFAQKYPEEKSESIHESE